jgi:hypothetical protein
MYLSIVIYTLILTINYFIKSDQIILQLNIFSYIVNAIIL